MAPLVVRSLSGSRAAITIRGGSDRKSPPPGSADSPTSGSRALELRKAGQPQCAWRPSGGFANRAAAWVERAEAFCPTGFGTGRRRIEADVIYAEGSKGIGVPSER